MVIPEWRSSPIRVNNPMPSTRLTRCLISMAGLIVPRAIIASSGGKAGMGLHSVTPFDLEFAGDDAVHGNGVFPVTAIEH